LVIVKKGDKDIEDLTDPASYRPSRLGPKRANNIRKTFRLAPEEDVRNFIVRRKIPKKEGANEKQKDRTKAPKIQRLITPQSLQRKRRNIAQKKHRFEKIKEKLLNIIKF